MPFVYGNADICCGVPQGLDLGVRLFDIIIFTVFVIISYHYQQITYGFMRVLNRLLVRCTPNHFLKWLAPSRRLFSCRQIQRNQECGCTSRTGDCLQTGNLKESLRICVENQLNRGFHCNAATEVCFLAVQQYKYCTEIGKYVALARSREFCVWFCCSRVRKDVKYQ